MDSQFLKTVLWTVISYLSGSILFSALLVRIFLKKRIKEIGDRNPGATNAFKAGGLKLGIPAVLLDFLKGALPVGLAHFLAGVRGWWLVPVALAPALGHAFSIFYKFKGGKAAAVTFGVWTGLTLWQGPTVLGALVGLSILIIKIDLWTVILPMLAFLIYVIPRSILAREYYLAAIWLGNLLIFIVKYLPELANPVRPHDWLVKLLGPKP